MRHCRCWMYRAENHIDIAHEIQHARAPSIHLFDGSCDFCGRHAPDVLQPGHTPIARRPCRLEQSFDPCTAIGKSNSLPEITVLRQSWWTALFDLRATFAEDLSCGAHSSLRLGGRNDDSIIRMKRDT